MAQRQFRSDDTDKWLYGFGDGSDGDLTISGNTTDAPIDSSCSGVAGQKTLSATNVNFAAGQLILVHKTRGNTTTAAGNWELNKIESYVAGTITTKYANIYSYQDSGNDQSQVIVMKQYNNVTVNNGVTWTAKAWNGNVGGILAYFSKGTVTVTGSINANSCGFRGGADNTTQQCGEGINGDRGTSTSTNGNGGAGGPNPGQSGGGGGGNANAGTTGGIEGGKGMTAAPGGIAVGNAALTLLTFGGGGGNGKPGSTNARGSGNGGGIILIIAKTFSSGAITCNGGDGIQAGGNDVSGSGGAGGDVLIKSQVATLGTNTILTSAGSGKNGAFNGNGGNGSVGRIHIDYKTSYTGTTNPTIDATQDATIDYPPSSNFFMFF